MEIRIAQGHDPELQDQAISIVIDVIRAYTMTHYAFLSGAERIYLYRDIDEARAVKAAHPDWILAGERKAMRIEGFDIGNSPAEVATMDLTGKTVVLSTTNGVPSALNALRHGPVLVTGFSNARDTVRAVQDMAARDGYARLNIVGSHPTGTEDMHCAEFIRHLLQDDESEHAVAQMREHVLASKAAQKFLDPEKPQFNAEDMRYCAAEVEPGRPRFTMHVHAADYGGLVQRVPLV